MVMVQDKLPAEVLGSQEVALRVKVLTLSINYSFSFNLRMKEGSS